jgi:hypothetical protein
MAAATLPVGRLPVVVRRVVLVALVLVGLAGVVFAFSKVDTGNEGTEVAVSDTGPVRRTVPPANSEILRQDAVGFDLNAGWTGVLVLNGVEIPRDQLEPAGVGIGEIRYVVGEGKVVERFVAGENCAQAVAWRVEQTRDDARTVSWCFSVT